MADEIQLGPYLFRLDHRGLLLGRTDGRLRTQTPFLLTFEQGHPHSRPEPLTIRRLLPVGSGGCDIHGFANDKISMDARVTYHRELDGLEISASLVNSAEDMHVCFAFHIDMVGEADPNWLIPGLFYGENRVRECQRIYPSYSEIHRDPTKFVTNHWLFRSDRTALPAVFCSTYNCFAFLATTPMGGTPNGKRIGEGITGLGLSNENGFPRLSVGVPFAEEPVKYSYCRDDRTDPERTYVRAEKNAPCELTILAGLHEPGESAWRSVYRSLYEGLWPSERLSPRLSAFEAEGLASEGLRKWHVDEDRAMIHETAAFDKYFGRRGQNYDREHMHVGWLSGAFPAYVLLWHGREAKDPETVRCATRVLDLITSDLAPCGTLWPLYTADLGFTAGFGPEDGLAHSRTVAEAVLFLLRALRLEFQANTSHPDWYVAVERTLDFVVARQRADGAFAAYWDLADGHVQDYEGTSGLCWVAPLIIFGGLVQDEKYHKAAVRAGQYYRRFIEQDFLYGGVEDLPLVPTVDDAHFALISYYLLFEDTHDPGWLELARHAADLALTYRMAYNQFFPPETMLARDGFQTRGADIQSVATPMLVANGLISYSEMLKLSALTGDPYYEQRAREARTYATQLLVRLDGHFNARKGQAVGQVFHTDWWQPKGIVLSLSHAWTGALINYVELIERNLSIPVQALKGEDLEAVNQAGRRRIIPTVDELLLPESAADIRQKEIERSTGDSSFEEESGPSDIEAFHSRIAEIIGLATDGRDLGPETSRRPTYGRNESGDGFARLPGEPVDGPQSAEQALADEPSEEEPMAEEPPQSEPSGLNGDQTPQPEDALEAEDSQKAEHAAESSDSRQSSDFLWTPPPQEDTGQTPQPEEEDPSQQEEAEGKEKTIEIKWKIF